MARPCSAPPPVLPILLTQNLTARTRQEVTSQDESFMTDISIRLHPGYIVAEATMQSIWKDIRTIWHAKCEKNRLLLPDGSFLDLLDHGTVSRKCNPWYATRVLKNVRSHLAFHVVWHTNQASTCRAIDWKYIIYLLTYYVTTSIYTVVICVGVPQLCFRLEFALPPTHPVHVGSTF